MEFCIYLKPIFLFLHMHADINRYDIVIIMPMMSCVAWCWEPNKSVLSPVLSSWEAYFRSGWMLLGNYHSQVPGWEFTMDTWTQWRVSRYVVVALCKSSLDCMGEYNCKVRLVVFQFCTYDTTFYQTLTRNFNSAQNMELMQFLQIHITIHNL